MAGDDGKERTYCLVVSLSRFFWLLPNYREPGRGKMSYSIQFSRVRRVAVFLENDTASITATLAALVL